MRRQNRECRAEPGDESRLPDTAGGQPTVAVRTLGCRLNQAESARMAGQLRAAGFALVPFGAPCDAVVIHTCTVTAHAEQTCLRLAAGCRRKQPDARIVLAGCAVAVHREHLRQHPAIDLLLDQDEKEGIARQLGRLLKAPAGGPPAPERPTAATTPCFATTRALVKVQDGCDFHCAYCVVPAARGAPRSRPVDEIVAEINQLTAGGHREIVLTGANLGMYRDADHRLPGLLRAIEARTGVERLRLSSIELSTVEDDILGQLAGSPVLCRYLHVPLQSGSDRVLRAMGRRHTAGAFRAFIERAGAKAPGIGIGTDVIAGFPGETDADFAATRDLIADLPLSNVHVFPYSERPGTPAAGLPGAVPVPVRRARARELSALGEQKRRAFADACMGRTVHVLVERVTRPGTAIGWSSEYLCVHVHAPQARRNDIIHCVPHAARDDILHAEAPATPDPA